jgi:hypothetical protein
MQRKQYKIIYVLTILAFITIFGCEQKEGSQSTDSQKKFKEESEKFSVGEKPTDSAFARKIVSPTDHKILQKYLPKNISGFTRLEETGATSSFGATTFATAEVIYTKTDGTTISVQILDYAGIDELYAPYDSYIRSNVSLDDEEGFAHTLKVNGHPAFESYQKNLKTAQLSVIVGDRIIVDINGTEVGTFDDLRTILKRIDLCKLEEIIK